MPRLKKDAIPSKLPNCPTYLSSSIQKRESPDSRRTRLEENALGKAKVQTLKNPGKRMKENSNKSICKSVNKKFRLSLGYILKHIKLVSVI